MRCGLLAPGTTSVNAKDGYVHVRHDHVVSGSFQNFCAYELVLGGSFADKRANNLTFPSVANLRTTYGETQAGQKKIELSPNERRVPTDGVSK